MTAEPYSWRNDPAMPAFDDSRPIFVFDGACAMCSHAARFVLRHDRKAALRLAPAQSPLGQALYRHLGLDSENFATNLLIERGRARVKSDGTIRLLVLLGLPWSLAAVLRVMPRPLLDRLYEWVARNRFRWFGRRTSCFVGEAADRTRFVE